MHTDNNPLTYLLTTAKLDAAGHRWLADLGMYKCSITYRSGRENVEADALSRIPRSISLNPPVVSALMESHQVTQCLAESICLSHDFQFSAAEDHCLNMLSMQEGQSGIPSISVDDWLDFQGKDTSIAAVLEFVRRG